MAEPSSELAPIPIEHARDSEPSHVIPMATEQRTQPQRHWESRKACQGPNPAALAKVLADQARRLRTLALPLLHPQNKASALRRRFDPLWPDRPFELTPEQRTDAFAQTLTCGLLVARWLFRDAGRQRFSRRSAAAYLPTTSPWLRNLVRTVLDAGDEPTLGKALDELTDLLEGMDLDAIFLDEGVSKDPLIHFYEPFLAAYDPATRKQRGVYFTPDPVVAWIVQAVDQALREGGYPLGLADAERHPSGALAGQFRVTILDPAAGTGTFLKHVVQRIHTTMQAHWTHCGLPEAAIPAAWNQYVRAQLLPRLHGFEIMMAPYAIGHLQLALTLRNTGYTLRPGDRIRVYLTNALEPPAAGDGAPERMAIDGQAAGALKASGAISVVIGNPPYAASSMNRLPWILEQLLPYKETVRLEEKQIQALSNDAVKFMRLAQRLVEKAPVGVVGIITGSGYVSGPLFRDMRRSLASTFDAIRILDLGGSVRHGTRGAERDENVFDIRQGVAITILSRAGGKLTAYRRIQGTRAEKFAFLEGDPAHAWVGDGALVRPFPPSPPHYDFAPVTPQDDAWRAWTPLPAIFGTGNPTVDQNLRWGAGFATRQDGFAVAFTPEEAVAQVTAFARHRGPVASFGRSQGIRLCTTSHWDPEVSRRRLGSVALRNHVQRVLYRPFDYRYVVYLRDVVLEPRTEFMESLFDTGSQDNNLALVSHRIINGEAPRHDFVATTPVDKIALSSKTSSNAFVFPLELGVRGGPRALNLAPGFVAAWTGVAEQPTAATARAVLAGVYAIVSAPSYRARFQERLVKDFARVPVPRTAALRERLETLGGGLIHWHAEAFRTLPEKSPTTCLCGDGDGVIGLKMPRYVPERQRVYINRTQFFDAISEDIWAFHIGGYAVCDKWLKQRRGRRLLGDDVAHFGQLVRALSETLRCMAGIDAAILDQGGWPDAFLPSSAPSPPDSGACVMARAGAR